MVWFQSNDILEKVKNSKERKKNSGCQELREKWREGQLKKAMEQAWGILGQ